MKNELEKLRLKLRLAYKKYHQSNAVAYKILITRYENIEKKMVQEEKKLMGLKHDK